ncbi:hypothetical protein BY996DRAFT_6434745 [Phakopsora pachyrhizi]|nr:hypothetical protein BY996DRAFT_6434745 [Phakopsora pachyrhizi]
MHQGLDDVAEACIFFYVQVDNLSIWDVLDSLNSTLIHSLRSATDSILPKISDYSVSFYNQLNSSLNSLLNHSLHLPFLRPSADSQPSNLSLASDFNSLDPHHSPGLIPLRRFDGTRSSWYSRLFRPRYILISLSIFFTSHLALDLLLSSDYLQNYLRSNPCLRRALPGWLITRVRRRRASRSIIHPNPRSDIGPGSNRLEALVLLGADPGSPAHLLSLHLASIGYVVIASVSRIEYVAQLEREGLGWVKALVLDHSTGQTNAFNRSLAASLSLSFPLNSALDSSRCDRRSSLVGMINCLPISIPHDLKPVENIEVVEDLLGGINRLAGVSLEIVKLVLPMMRNSIERQGRGDAVLLTLFPTRTSSLALPFISTSYVSNRTLESLMTALRRELKISTSASKNQIRIINEKIGLLSPSPQSTTPMIPGLIQTSPAPPSLPVHLHPIYASSLSRRIPFLSVPSTNLPILSTRGSSMSHLLHRIRNGSTTCIGKSVWKYRLIRSLGSDSMIESWQRVVSEIDLESRETLEKVVGKREFSDRSGWKAGLFMERSGESDEDEVRESDEVEGGSEAKEDLEGKHDLKEDQNGEKEADDEGKVEDEKEVSDEEKGQDSEDIRVDVKQEEDQKVLLEVDDGEDVESCVDKGEDAGRESFVGSEIDWRSKE